MLGLPVSQFVLNAFRGSDAEIIKNIQRKLSTEGVNVRRKLRVIRKGFKDKEKENEETHACSAGSY